MEEKIKIINLTDKQTKLIKTKQNKELQKSKEVINKYFKNIKNFIGEEVDENFKAEEESTIFVINENRVQYIYSLIIITHSSKISIDFTRNFNYDECVGTDVTLEFSSKQEKRNKVYTVKFENLDDDYSNLENMIFEEIIKWIKWK